MAEEEEIGARLRLRDRRQFSNEADAASRSIEGLGDSAKRADGKGRGLGATFGGLARTLGGIAVKGALAGTAALGGLAASAIAVGVGYNTLEQRSRAAFTTMLGSRKAANAFMDEIAEFGSTSPFPRQAFIAGAQQLVGFGVEARKVIPIMDSIQDAVAATGGGGEELSRIIGVFADIQGQGKITGDALMQMGVLGIDAAKMIADATGLSTDDVRKSISKGNIGAAASIDILTSGLTKRFGGAADNVKETWVGSMDRIKAAWRDIGGVLVAPFIDPKGGGMAITWANNFATRLWGIKAAIPGIVEAAPGIWKSFQAGDMTGIEDAFTGLFGDVAAGPLTEVVSILRDMATVGTDLLLPTLKDLTAGSSGFITPLGVARDLLGFMADNAEDLQPWLTGLIVSFLAWKTVVTLQNIQMSIANGLATVKAVKLGLLTGATVAQTGAEKLNRKAVLQNTAAHVRAGVMVAAHATKAVASATVIVTKVVAGWFLMGAKALLHGAVIAGQWVLMGVRAVAAGIVMTVQAALVVGKWILMGATAMASGIMMAAAWIIGLGPIGLAIAALLIIGGIFILLWKKSETFRNIVKGALSAVGGAAVAAKDWIVGAFNSVVGFFTGLPARISSAASGLFDGIKNAFKSAVNWIIDKWNGLSFKLPSIDTHIPGIGKVGGFTLGAPNIPRLHTGGTVASGGAVNILPGEEIVVLPPAATVVPMSAEVAATMASRGNSGPTILQVILDRKVLAEAVYDHTGDKVARA